MSWGCNEDEPETTAQRKQRLQKAIDAEQEIIDKREADAMERRLSDMRTANAKFEVDDRF